MLVLTELENRNEPTDVVNMGPVHLHYKEEVMTNYCHKVLLSFKWHYKIYLLQPKKKNKNKNCAYNLDQNDFFFLRKLEMSRGC